MTMCYLIRQAAALVASPPYHDALITPIAYET